MTNYKYIKPFLITTIIIKIIIDLIVSFYYLIESMYFFAFAYLIFNCFTICLIAREKKEDLKSTIMISIVSDQAYSFFLGLFFTKKIYELIFFYPTTSLLYFIGIETFIKSKTTLIITTIFTIMFFLHALYIVVLDHKSLINYSFLMLFGMQILFMIYKITVTKKETQNE